MSRKDWIDGLAGGGYPGTTGGRGYSDYGRGASLEVDFGNGGKRKRRPHPEHRGSPISVGSYKIFAGALRSLQAEDLEKVDIVIPLEEYVPTRIGQRVEILACPWKDMSPPPEGFEEFLREHVIPLLQKGKRIMVYCIGGHGRTGTFIASLIALLEPQTLDPIAAVRKRHCRKAVETCRQAASIFALRGEALPERYDREFYRAPVFHSPAAYKGGVVRGATVSSASGKVPEFLAGVDLPDLTRMTPAEIRAFFGPGSAMSQQERQPTALPEGGSDEP